MKLKKIVSFVFVLVLITGSFLCFSPKKVSANAAPPVTTFYIMGYSWPSLYSDGNQYHNKSQASAVPVQGSTPYIVTYQLGYGKILSPYNMDTIDSFPITDSSNVAIGFVKVTSLKNLPTGSNNINIACNSYNSPWNTMRDSITLNIQPQSSTLTNSLTSVNLTTSQNIKDIKNIKYIKDINDLKGIKFLDDTKDLKDLKNN
jgi:hypothetical protein